MSKKTFIFVFLCICYLALPKTILATAIDEEKFIIAHKAFSDGFYGASIELFNRFLVEFPQNKKIPQAKLYIAKCYFFKSEYPQALEILNRLIEKNITIDFYDELLYWLSEIHFKGRNYTESLKFASKLINQYPESKFYWRAYYRMGTNQLTLNQTETAEKTLQVITQKCDIQEVTKNSYTDLLSYYFENKEYKKIISLALDYLKNYPNTPFVPTALFYIGESYRLSEEFNKAISYYEQALETTENSYLRDLVSQGIVFTFLSMEQFQRAHEQLQLLQNQELFTYMQAQYFITLRDNENALKELELFLTHYPESKYRVNAMMQRANLFYKTDNLDKAIVIYQNLLTENKQNIEIRDKAYYGLAWCYLKKGEFERAIKQFKNTLEYTSNPTVRLNTQIQIADAYQEGQESETALTMYNDILHTYPNNIYTDYIQLQIGMIFLKLGNISQATLAFKNLISNFPSSKLIPDANYYLAMCYFSQTDYNEAGLILKKFIDSFPYNPLYVNSYYLYGKCFYNIQDFSKALAIFTQIKDKFPHKDIEDVIEIDIANAYINLSQIEEAKKIWKKFVITKPNSSYLGYVILQLGSIHEQENNFKEAESYYEKIINEFPNSQWLSEAQFSLGHLYLSENMLDQAKGLFEKVAKENSAVAIKAKLFLAKVFDQQNDFTHALGLYDEILNNPSGVSKAAIIDKSLLLKKLNRYPEAIESFQAAVKQGVTSAEIHFSLGLCYEKVNEPKNAIDEYFKVVYQFGKNDFTTKAYFRVAKIYEKENNMIAAQEIYRKIVKMNIAESKIAKLRLTDLE